MRNDNLINRADFEPVTPVYVKHVRNIRIFNPQNVDPYDDSGDFVFPVNFSKSLKVAIKLAQL